jgi:hypothetical protein
MGYRVRLRPEGELYDRIVLVYAYQPDDARLFALRHYPHADIRWVRRQRAS